MKRFAAGGGDRRGRFRIELTIPRAAAHQVTVPVLAQPGEIVLAKPRSITISAPPGTPKLSAIAGVSSAPEASTSRA